MACRTLSLHIQGSRGPSTHTALKRQGTFNPPSSPGDDTQDSDAGGWSHAGRKLHFGVREHAMGAILIGMLAHGGYVPFGSTFFIFSDYLCGPPSDWPL